MSSLNAQFALTVPASWQRVLSDEFDQPYYDRLLQELRQRAASGAIIYPPQEQIFGAFASTPFDSVHVVLLGQDPYHGANQAHGLAFSVNRGVPVPPSLRNIYQELSADVDFVAPTHGCLQEWAAQGVLLLNSVLTVEHGAAGSHQKLGWEQLTDATIHAISQHRNNVVFLLWGAHARSKKGLIDARKHLILTAPHPSPLSVYRGFYGCRHFSKANDYLSAHGGIPINWQLS